MRGDRSAIEAVRHAPALRDPHGVARLLGLHVAKGTSGRARVVRVLCPWHSDKGPSCDLTVRDGALVARCRSCNMGGDILSLVALHEGLDYRRDFPAVLQAAAELGGVDLGAHHVPVGPRRPERSPEEKVRDARKELGEARRERDELHDLLEELAAERVVRQALHKVELEAAARLMLGASIERARVAGALRRMPPPLRTARLLLLRAVAEIEACDGGKALVRMREAAAELKPRPVEAQAAGGAR